MTRICRQIETWMASLKLYWYFCRDIHRDCSKNLELWLTRASYLFLDVNANWSFKGKWKGPVLHWALVYCYKEEFFLDLTNQQDMSCLFWYSGIQIPTNIINQYQITESYSKSRVTNMCVRLCNWVIGHHMLSFKNAVFASFWKGWNKWSDCLWPRERKWNKNSWVGQEGDESCYSQLIRKGQKSGLQELGQLSGSKAIASVLDSYPNPLKWTLVLAKSAETWQYIVGNAWQKWKRNCF